MRALPLVLAAAACAVPQPRGGQDEDLSRLLAGRTAGAAQSCVAADDVTMLRVLDPHTVGFERGAILWVSRLPRDCPRLSASDALAVEMHGREYCRDDRFRTISPGMTVAGPVCTLGEFVPYRRAR
jgi:hypothetical protein